MEIFNFEEDIKVICVRASSFPEGIMAAHQKLHALLPDIEQRKIFGISRPEDGKIIYKAAAEVKDTDDVKLLDHQMFVIEKGKYLSETIENFMEDIPKIGLTFQKLIAQPNIDPEGYCLEDYINETDVRCMVGIKREN
ncbi:MULTISPECIES: transcriptional regulator [Pedobacter]|uniref:transcriptional regulator n=1 Tax=Pedobacter TaxID=84567 RepID=UPI001E3B7019|nr:MULTISPECIES: transcriptional regulator [Pedobacter]